MQHWISIRPTYHRSPSYSAIASWKSYRIFSSNSCYYVGNRIRLFHRVVINLPSTAWLAGLFGRIPRYLNSSTGGGAILFKFASSSSILKLFISKHRSFPLSWFFFYSGFILAFIVDSVASISRYIFFHITMTVKNNFEVSSIDTLCFSQSWNLSREFDGRYYYLQSTSMCYMWVILSGFMSPTTNLQKLLIYSSDLQLILEIYRTFHAFVEIRVPTKLSCHEQWLIAVQLTLRVRCGCFSPLRQYMLQFS